MRRLVTAALLVLAACPGNNHSSPGKTAGEGCATRAECQATLVCLAGKCTEGPPAAASCPAAPGTAAISAGEPGGPATDPGVCVSTERSTILPSEMVQDLGVRQVGTGATFDIPAGTSSFVLFSQEVGNSAPDDVVAGGTTLPNTVVPTDLRSPTGTLYYDDLAGWPAVTLGGMRYGDASSLLGYDLGLQRISGSFPVPNTSAAVDRILTDGAVAPGTWSFTVHDWAQACPFSDCASGNTSGQYRIHAVKRPGSIASTGTIDLEVYIATDLSTSVVPNAAAAASHPQVARWVQSVGHFLANAGLCLGNVTFHDVPEWARARYAANGTVDVTDSGPCGDLSQLFTTATIQNRAVHLFIADEIVDTSGTGQPGQTFTVGVDGSIPGPTGFPGTIYGGAIIGLFGEFDFGNCSGQTTLADCGTDRLAYVAAHEIGHWLGLYHPTEWFGTIFDPVADTDRCPCLSCVPQSQRNGCAEVKSPPQTAVTNEFCNVSSSCGGGNNLMFWLLDEKISTGELSRDQGQIVRLNPAVR